MAITREQSEQFERILHYYASLVTECAVYDWDAEFVKQQIKNAQSLLNKEIEKLGIDFNSLTHEDCKMLGCDKEGYIPLYLLEAIPDGTRVISCLEKPMIVGEEYIDNDNRCGFSAYRLLATDDFAVYIKTSDDKEMIITVQEGSGDNLLQEDIDEGYTDYFNYSTYYIEKDQEGNLQIIPSDGGMALLEQSYDLYSVEEIIQNAVDQAGMQSKDIENMGVLSQKFDTEFFEDTHTIDDKNAVLDFEMMKRHIGKNLCLEEQEKE